MTAAPHDAPVNAARSRSHALKGAWIAIAVLALGLSLTATVAIGTAQLSLPLVWGGIAHHLGLIAAPAGWEGGAQAIVWELRLPRAILAALVGAGLAVTGATLQALTRNPLADPHLLGISSGAALGAVLVLLHLGPVLGPWTVQIAAFIGGIGALAIVVGVAGTVGGMTASRLILGGVAVSFALMAAANFLIFLADHRASHNAVFWMLGGLGRARWDILAIPAIVVGLVTAIIFINARALNALMVGEETAVSLGIRAGAVRLCLFGLCALMTGVLVAVSGTIGFVGLMIPHIARYFVGSDNRRVLPLSALIGAIFLAWVDALARIALAPADLPVGIVTGALGGVFFIWLMQRRHTFG